MVFFFPSFCFPAPAAELLPSQTLHHVPHQHWLLHQQLLRVGISTEEHLRFCGTETPRTPNEPVNEVVEPNNELFNNCRTPIQTDQISHYRKNALLLNKRKEKIRKENTQIEDGDLLNMAPRLAIEYFSVSTVSILFMSEVLLSPVSECSPPDIVMNSIACTNTSF